MKKLLAFVGLVVGLVAFGRSVSAAILYPCGCSEYYVKTCTNCPGTSPCGEDFCTRTTTWQGATCKQHGDPGTCLVSTNQPGFENKDEWWYCDESNGCKCPTSDPTYVWTTPTTVSVLAPGTTLCPSLQCNQNRNCIPQ